MSWPWSNEWDGHNEEVDEYRDRITSDPTMELLSVDLPNSENQPQQIGDTVLDGLARSRTTGRTQGYEADSSYPPRGNDLDQLEDALERVDSLLYETPAGTFCFDEQDDLDRFR